VVDIPLGAHVRNVTVISNSVVELEYYPDSAGIVDLFRVQRKEGASIFQDWPVNNTGSTGVPPYQIYRDENAGTNRRPYWYRFYREDECANSYITDSLRTIYLDAELGLGLTGDLRWTEHVNGEGSLIRYVINKILNGDTTQIATVGPSVLEYEDMNALNPSTLDTVCYFITAEVDLNIPGVVSTTVFSNSNAVCLQPQPRIFAPKAFRPEGFNTIFKPIIQFGTNINYNFRVWDRLGRKLFETDDVNLGWDGTFKNQIVPLDNYVYFVTFEGQDGNTYSKAGNVILVR
jgi:gliding motility-associated-like protein